MVLGYYVMSNLPFKLGGTFLEVQIDCKSIKIGFYRK